MIDEIPEADFLEGLRCGVKRTTDLMARITDYHGGQVRTEYIMTADLAREFMERGFEVRVECLSRQLVKGMTALRAATPRKLLRSKRFDVALVENQILPKAIIEVKIGAKKLSRLKGDLDKITTTIGMMKAKFAAQTIGAAVFQVHVPGSRARYLAEHFKATVEKAEEGIKAELEVYALSRPGFRFAMHPLQSANAGIVERDVEGLGDDQAWGQHGHATRYHAILIRSTRPVPSYPATIEGLKMASQE